MLRAAAHVLQPHLTTPSALQPSAMHEEQAAVQPVVHHALGAGHQWQEPLDLLRRHVLVMMATTLSWAR